MTCAVHSISGRASSWTPTTRRLTEKLLDPEMSEEARKLARRDLEEREHFHKFVKSYESFDGILIGSDSEFETKFDGFMMSLKAYMCTLWLYDPVESDYVDG